MSYELKMPKLGESLTEGTIGKWLKQPGEKVNKYDLLVEVQTDKVNTEIPSPVAGTLKEVKVQEGQTVPIGTLLAIFDTADGEAAATAPPAPPQRQQTAAPAAPPAPAAAPQAEREPRAEAPSPRAPAAPAATAESPDLSDVRATPAVRKLAGENGIDISQTEGTRLGGRASRKGGEDFLAQRQSPQPGGRRVRPARA